MAKPSISILSSPEDLGLIYTEQNQINIKFIDFNIPFTSTSGRLSWNVGGKTRLIVLQGAHDGSNFSGSDQDDKLANFIAAMEAWINIDGAQANAILTDSLGYTYNVDCVDWQWTRRRDDPNRLLYNLILKES